MALKTYVLSFADSIKHVPEHPERTAMKSLAWDVRYQVWTSRAAMLKTIDMQGRSAPRADHWRACKIPLTAEQQRARDDAYLAKIPNNSREA